MSSLRAIPEAEAKAIVASRFIKHICQISFQVNQLQARQYKDLPSNDLMYAVGLLVKRLKTMKLGEGVGNPVFFHSELHRSFKRVIDGTADVNKKGHQYLMGYQGYLTVVGMEVVNEINNSALKDKIEFNVDVHALASSYLKEILSFMVSYWPQFQLKEFLKDIPKNI